MSNPLRMAWRPPPLPDPPNAAALAAAVGDAASALPLMHPLVLAGKYHLYNTKEKFPVPGRAWLASIVRLRLAPHAPPPSPLQALFVKMPPDGRR